MRPMPVLGASYAADLVVAGAAVDRAVSARNERDFRHHTTLRTGGGVHLTRRLATEAGEHAVLHIALFGLGNTGRATGCAATRAACGLVLQPLLGVELLLAGREDERAAAVLAVNLFVYECQLGESSLGWGREKP